MAGPGRVGRAVGRAASRALGRAVAGAGAIGILLATACIKLPVPIAGGLTKVDQPEVVVAQPQEVDLTLFLIGDAGAPDRDEPVLAALTQQVRANPEGKSVIVYLGDNIYPRGLPEEGNPLRKMAEERINPQVDLATRTKTRTFFIPGNHDWAFMTPAGWDAIRRQVAYIDERGAPYARMLPEGGCPGPETVDPSPLVRLVMLDTQWWLHDYDRPFGEESACPAGTPTAVVNALYRALRTAGDRHVVVLGHHPLASGGLHGGHLGWQSHIFPLRSIAKWLYIPVPVLGSYYALNREQGASNQDLSGPRNQRMRRAFEMVFEKRPPLVYAAGHDHDLQVIKGRTARYLLVSGSGIFGHISGVDDLPNSLFAAAQSGFMRLDFLRDRRVRLGVVVVDAEGGNHERFAMYLDTDSKRE